MFRYTCRVFGVAISCLHAERWAEGQVYRLTGGNDAVSWFDAAETRDVAFHVLGLLDGAGFARLMTFDDYRAESQRRRSHEPP